MSEDIRLLPGEYTWTMARVRKLGNKRVCMGIMKGDAMVGLIFWHPASKCIVYHGKYNNTPELLRFALRYMDKKLFYACWRICKAIIKSKELETVK